MDKKLAKIDENPSTSSEKPKVFTALHRDPKYRKANAEFLTRRLRLEFDKLTTARPLCRGVSCTAPLPPEFQKCHRSKLKTNAKKSRKRSNCIEYAMHFALSWVSTVRTPHTYKHFLLI